MTYTPTIYDWRSSVAPIDQVFRAGGSAVAGGMTLGGASISNPEPGGRGELVMNFAPFATEESNLAASWTISRMMNGAIFRVRLYRTVQLVSETALSTSDTPGNPWSNSEPWSTGENWASDPVAEVAASAAKGASTFTADLSIMGQVLDLGHVVGFFVDGYNFSHVVTDVEYDTDDVATVTITPPLRRALTTSDLMNFRPAMLVTCANPAEVMTNYTSGRHMALSTARFVEALV